jgi:glycosyltransferase involved in cell wall biosynthesis
MLCFEMLSRPRTLVVTPTYCTPENQRLPLLLQCLYWVEHQTDQNSLHVVVDDGSTDKTPEVLERIAARNERLLMYHQSNKGSSSAVNFGVEQALRRCTPDYITITHSDDVLTPRSLDLRVTAAQSSRAQFVYGDAILFYENLSVDASLLSSPHYRTSAHLYTSLIYRGFIPYPTMFWTRDLFTRELGGYDSNITSAEDWDIALRSAKALERRRAFFSELSDVTVISRQHEHNLWKENVRNGVRKRCVHAILAKHLKGLAYQSELVKRGVDSSMGLARAYLPEPLKVPLRFIRRSLFPSVYQHLKTEDETFLKRMRGVDYQQHFSYAFA